MSITTIHSSNTLGPQTMAEKISVSQLPAIEDNYIYVIHNHSNGKNIVVDPGTAEPVIDFLTAQKQNLDAIIITHHHWDHVDGVEDLVAKYRCRVYAFEYDLQRVPAVTDKVSPPHSVEVCGLKFDTETIPGHTLGHICYYLPEHKYLFSGDTLFSLGCGRLFEGTPEQMLSSLMKIRQLPSDTTIFSAHEYTEKNAEFAISLEPNNQLLQGQLDEVRQLRKAEKPTVPTTLSHETYLNPFLRWDDPALRKAIGMESATDLEVFTQLRRLKDKYK